MPTATAGFASTLIKGLSECLASASQHPKAGGLRWCDDPAVQVGLGGAPHSWDGKPHLNHCFQPGVAGNTKFADTWPAPKQPPSLQREIFQEKKKKKGMGNSFFVIPS